MFRLVNVEGRAALERNGQWYDLGELSGDPDLADPLVAVAHHRELHVLHGLCEEATASGRIAESHARRARTATASGVRHRSELPRPRG